jgi:hypothetical protein
MTFALSSIGGIVAALVLFIILKRVIGLVFRVILAGVLLLAIVIGAWWWSRPSSPSTANDGNARPQQTQPARKKR